MPWKHILSALASSFFLRALSGLLVLRGRTFATVSGGSPGSQVVHAYGSLGLPLLAFSTGFHLKHGHPFCQTGKMWWRTNLEGQGIGIVSVLE